MEKGESGPLLCGGRCSIKKLMAVSHGGDDADDQVHIIVSTDISSSIASELVNPEAILPVQCDWRKINQKEDHHSVSTTPKASSQTAEQVVLNTGSKLNKIRNRPLLPRSSREPKNAENGEKSKKSTPVIVPPQLPHSKISTSTRKKKGLQSSMKSKGSGMNGKENSLNFPKIGTFVEEIAGLRHGKGRLIGEKCSFKVEVIDETILIQSPSVIRSCVYNGNKHMDFLNQKMNLEKSSNNKCDDGVILGGKKGMRSATKGAKRVDFTGKAGRLVYSRTEMESLRYKNSVDQRKMWNEIHHALGPVDGKAYDELGKCKQLQHPQKLIPSNLGPLLIFGN